MVVLLTPTPASTGGLLQKWGFLSPTTRVVVAFEQQLNRPTYLLYTCTYNMSVQYSVPSRDLKFGTVVIVRCH